MKSEIEIEGKILTLNGF